MDSLTPQRPGLAVGYIVVGAPLIVLYITFCPDIRSHYVSRQRLMAFEVLMIIEVKQW